MSAAPSPPPDLRAVGETDIAACFPLMRQLRPQLDSSAGFIARWRRQSADGYRLLALWRDGAPLALAGYRFQENLVHGRFLYVDDLVTEAAARGEGLGARLLAALKAEAKARDCARLVLDTALDNVLGHRFYYRQGLLAGALRFNVPLG
jgi:ribosomal protein S18 acetylase RimI-like enzyme